MSSTIPQTSLDPPELAGAPAARRRRRKAAWLITTAIVLIATVVTLAITDPFKSGASSHQDVTGNAYPTSLATVAVRSLSQQTQVSATLGYAGSYSAINQTQGTYTSLPAVGQVISQGQVLYQVDGKPVVLLYGSTPAYRSLSEGATASDVTGPDVAELNADLVALGYATSSEIPAGSDQFSYWTKVGMEKLQAALGVTQTGTLTLGQAVFLPTTARVTALTPSLGSPAQAGQAVLTTTSTSRQVTIDLDAAQQSEIKVGDQVTITLPNNQTTPGVVSSVGTVATTPSSSSSNTTPTITVEVTPTDPTVTGSWDQAPVNVTITTATVTNAVVVPVNSLVALAGGGYAVETVGADGIHTLVTVSLGLFDQADGLVQVTSSGLTAGQRVVVPAT